MIQPLLLRARGAYALLLPLAIATSACGQSAATQATPAGAPGTQAPGATATYSAADASQRLNQLAGKMETYLLDLPVDSTQIPRAVAEDGTVEAVKARDWTSGFFPGTLWQLNAAAPNPQLEKAAATWTEFVRDQQFDDHTHDLGFKLYCSFGQGYTLAGKTEYESVIVQAATTLIERYSPVVKSIRSWDHNSDKWDYPVIIDNLMNLEMLFEATRLTGDSTFHHIAAQHAATTYKNHFRPDNSSYHVVSYDTLTGEVAKRQTHQGYADESAWARGQAWGLYGFTVAYRYTRRPEYLQRARDIATYFFSRPNLREDLIPYWDFSIPDTTGAPRDVSAAAVIASGLLELQEYAPEDRAQDIAWADGILNTLEQPTYQAKVSPFLLAHSTGNYPKKSEIDVPINYADYYYVEALRRRAMLPD